jgi:hypothetical protein
MRSKAVRPTVELPRLRLERSQKAAKLYAGFPSHALDQCLNGIGPAQPVTKNFRAQQFDLTALRRAGFVVMIRGKEDK